MRRKTRRNKSGRSKPVRGKLRRTNKRRSRRSRGGANKENGPKTNSVNANSTSVNGPTSAENVLNGNSLNKLFSKNGLGASAEANSTSVSGPTSAENVNSNSLNKLFSKNGLGASSQDNSTVKLENGPTEASTTVNMKNGPANQIESTEEVKLENGPKEGAQEVPQEVKLENGAQEVPQEVVEGEAQEVVEKEAKVEIEALKQDKPEEVKQAKFSLIQTMMKGYELYKAGDMTGLMQLGITNLDNVFKNEKLREKFEEYATKGIDKLNDIEFDEITSKLEKVGVPILSQLKLRIAPSATTQGSEVSGNIQVNTLLAAPKLRNEVAISSNNSAKGDRNAQTQANITKLASTLKQAAINAQTMSNHLKKGGGKIKSRRKRGGCLNGTCKY